MYDIVFGLLDTLASTKKMERINESKEFVCCQFQILKMKKGKINYGQVGVIS